ncbi:Cyclin-dependent kinase 9-A [Chionoecetes opilio]|uniref:Cyclin-dependent kinase 9-A n=1 Tax=Chionoecetes opilio TaxID=41210 RepID=A0A8J4YVC1_CHIOP|nr:Cyclin-dependent kinase 9-A [Chionoecetes opilio]
MSKAAAYYDDLEFPFCDDVIKYEKLAKIGQGTFGEVFKARDRRTGKVVALKKILMENEKEGFPITALREIRILKLLRHENVVNLLEIARTKGPPPPGLQKPVKGNITAFDLFVCRSAWLHEKVSNLKSYWLRFFLKVHSIFKIPVSTFLRSFWICKQFSRPLAR